MLDIVKKGGIRILGLVEEILEDAKGSLIFHVSHLIGRKIIPCELNLMVSVLSTRRE